jgi:hypothetical protein
MSVLECPWSDEPMSWNARDRVKWLLSSRFRQNLTARRAREAEVRRLRLNDDAPMFVREIYHQQLYENDELRLKPEPFADAVRRQLDEALSHAPTEIDPPVARALLEHALVERARWIIDARFTGGRAGALGSGTGRGSVVLGGQVLDALGVRCGPGGRGAVVVAESAPPEHGVHRRHRVDADHLGWRAGRR